MPKETLSAEQRTAIEAEAAALIAELKRVMGDPGRRGVPHAEFLAGWDGHRLRTPALPPSLVEPLMRTRIAQPGVFEAGGCFIFWHLHPEASEAPPAPGERFDRLKGSWPFPRHLKMC